MNKFKRWFHSLSQFIQTVLIIFILCIPLVLTLFMLPCIAIPTLTIGISVSGRVSDWTLPEIKTIAIILIITLVSFINCKIARKLIN